jgi:hypothetical protein
MMIRFRLPNHCHSRESGNPVSFVTTLGPRLRGDDDFSVLIGEIGTFRANGVPLSRE